MGIHKPMAKTSKKTIKKKAKKKTTKKKTTTKKKAVRTKNSGTKKKKKTSSSTKTTSSDSSIMGRPKRDLTESEWKQVKTCCEIHCTGEEIAAIIGIDYDTLNRNVIETHGVTFSDYFEQKSAGGKMSLRRVQYTAAQNGNTAMQIWLGKQWLNQKDKAEFSGDESSPIRLAYPLPTK